MTAVKWLESEMLKPNLSMRDILEQAKALEKQQIENAYWDGGEDMPMISKQCEQYYNEKFEA